MVYFHHSAASVKFILINISIYLFLGTYNLSKNCKFYRYFTIIPIVMIYLIHNLGKVIIAVHLNMIYSWIGSLFFREDYIEAYAQHKV